MVSRETSPAGCPFRLEEGSFLGHTRTPGIAGGARGGQPEPLQGGRGGDLAIGNQAKEVKAGRRPTIWGATGWLGDDQDAVDSKQWGRAFSRDRWGPERPGDDQVGAGPPSRVLADDLSPLGEHDNSVGQP